MASFDSSGWPSGATVTVYARDAFGNATGASVTSATASAAGVASFAGLADSGKYVATDGSRTVKFGTPPASSSSGSSGAWRGAWDPATAYIIGDRVSAAGSSWIAIAASTGVDPATDTGAAWNLLASSGAPGPAGDPGPAGVTRFVAAGNITGNYTLDCQSQRDVMLVATLTGNVTLTLTNLIAGASVTLYLIQDATGGRTLNITGVGAVALASTAAASHTIVSIITPDGGALDVMEIGAQNPMTAAGDIIIGGTAGRMTRLAKGTDGQVLKLASGAPAWQTQSSSGVIAAVELRVSANFAAATGAATPVVWDVETADPQGVHDLVTNPSRVTTPVGASFAMISGGLTIDSTSGTRRIGLNVNGTELRRNPAFTTDGSNARGFFNTILAVTPGDYLEMTQISTAGGNVLTSAGTYFGVLFF